jgi:hypothetical protein
VRSECTGPTRTDRVVLAILRPPLRIVWPIAKRIPKPMIRAAVWIGDFLL